MNKVDIAKDFVMQKGILWGAEGDTGWCVLGKKGLPERSITKDDVRYYLVQMLLGDPEKYGDFPVTKALVKEVEWLARYLPGGRLRYLN